VNKSLEMLDVNCQVSNNKLNSSLISQQKMIANYTATLKKVPSKASLEKLISDLEVNQTKIKDYKNSYIKSYNASNATYVKFMVLANKSLDIIENCGIPKMKSLYSSLKSNTTSQALIVMVVDDYTKCFKQYKNILSKELYKFDDTKDQSFNKSFAYNLNRSDYDRIDGNYLQGVNSSMQLNLTLRAFIDYQATKLKFYANFSSIIINLDTQTKAYAKKIDDHKKKLKYFENIRKTVTKLINGTQATMKNVEESIDILTKDCNAQSTVLKGKIARNKADLKSFEKLIDYFRENYYKISEDLRKKNMTQSQLLVL